MKIIIHGANGKMGRNVSTLAEENYADASVAALVSRSFSNDNERNTFRNLSDFNGEADCLIDFSNHTVTTEVLNYCLAHKLPVMIATTGHTPEEIENIKSASDSIPVFYASNTSIGVALLIELAQKAARSFPDADIEIIEKHHNQKVDVPSGTALSIARAIKEVRENSEFLIGRNKNGIRQKNEIGIHSVRIGNEIGTHEIIISTGLETITLKHEAENRALFAQGALQAAAFLINQPSGLYGMKDLMR